MSGNVVANCLRADLAVPDGPRQSGDAQISERESGLGAGGAEEHGSLVIQSTAL